MPPRPDLLIKTILFVVLASYGFVIICVFIALFIAALKP